MQSVFLCIFPAARTCLSSGRDGTTLIPSCDRKKTADRFIAFAWETRDDFWSRLRSHVPVENSLDQEPGAALGAWSLWTLTLDHSNM